MFKENIVRKFDPFKLTPGSIIKLEVIQEDKKHLSGFYIIQSSDEEIILCHGKEPGTLRLYLKDYEKDYTFKRVNMHSMSYTGDSVKSEL